VTPTDLRSPNNGQTGRRDWIGITVIIIIAAAVIIYAGREVTFIIDEWKLIQSRTDTTTASLFDSLNNHLMVVPIGITQILYRLFGISSHFPYRLLLLATHLAAATALFAYLRKRISYWSTLAITAVFALYGYAAAILIWPISLGWTLAVFGGMMALLLLDRKHLATDIGACGALALSVAATSIGVPFALGVAVELAIGRQWRKLWIPGVPLVGYVIWYFAYSPGRLSSASLETTLRFAEELAAQTIGTLLGVSARGIFANIALGLVVVVLATAWWRLGKSRSPRLVGLATTLIIMIGALAYGRASSGLNGWFSYAVGAVLLLLVGEIFKDSSNPRRLIQILIVGVAIWSIIWNLGQLNNESHRFRLITETEKTQLAVLGVINKQVPDSFMPGPFLQTLTTGRYREVVLEFGTPAFTIAEAKSAHRLARRNGDETLVRGLDLRALPRATGTPEIRITGTGTPVGQLTVRKGQSLTTTGTATGTTTGCAEIIPTAGPAIVTIRNPSLNLVIEAIDQRATIAAGILKPGSQPIGQLSAGKQTVINAPAVPRLGQWTLKVVSSGTVRICAGN